MKVHRTQVSSVLFWYNVWASGARNWGDIFSRIGGDWKEQTHATKNIFIDDSHVYPLRMFFKIHNFVIDYLNTPMSTTK